jgi:hypothetical protein
MLDVGIDSSIFLDSNEMLSAPTDRSPEARKTVIVPRFSGVRYQIPWNSCDGETGFASLPGEGAPSGLAESAAPGRANEIEGPLRMSRNATQETD